MLQVAGRFFSLRSRSRSSGEVQRQRAVSGYYYVELSSFCITTIWEGAGALLKASLANAMWAASAIKNRDVGATSSTGRACDGPATCPEWLMTKQAVRRPRCASYGRCLPGLVNSNRRDSFIHVTSPLCSQTGRTGGARTLVPPTPNTDHRVHLIIYK